MVGEALVNSIAIFEYNPNENVTYNDMAMQNFEVGYKTRKQKLKEKEEKEKDKKDKENSSGNSSEGAIRDVFEVKRDKVVLRNLEEQNITLYQIQEFSNLFVKFAESNMGIGLFYITFEKFFIRYLKQISK
jgi:hypothetical protein